MGSAPGDAAFWKLSYQKGLEPDARLVMCNGGYNAGSRGQYCGAYDRDLRADGALPYQLGLYTPNSYGVMRSTVFFNDKGANALIFAINRPRDWKTPARRVWSDIDAPENLYFYRHDGDAYARLALVGQRAALGTGADPARGSGHQRVAGVAGRSRAGPEEEHAAAVSRPQEPRRLSGRQRRAVRRRAGGAAVAAADRLQPQRL